MKTILVVDDEKNIRRLYEKELARDGYKVLIVGSGEEALQTVEATPPDLIVLDIRMPKTDGIETLSKLMAKHRKIPVKRRGAEVFVHLVEAIEHGEEIVRADGDHR